MSPILSTPANRPRPQSYTPRNPVVLSRALKGGLGVATLMIFLALIGLRWNASPSLPTGFYLTSSSATLERGAIVSFCLRGDVAQITFERHYVMDGSCPRDIQPIGKVIYGMPGDLITHTPDYLAINGDRIPNSPTYRRDSENRPMPHARWGEILLKKGEYWVYSPYHPRAFDSRYYGPIQHSQIRAHLRPLWTWLP